MQRLHLPHARTVGRSQILLSAKGIIKGVTALGCFCRAVTSTGSLQARPSTEARLHGHPWMSRGGSQFPMQRTGLQHPLQNPKPRSRTSSQFCHCLSAPGEEGCNQALRPGTGAQAGPAPTPGSRVGTKTQSLLQLCPGRAWARLTQHGAFGEFW